MLRVDITGERESDWKPDFNLHGWEHGAGHHASQLWFSGAFFVRSVEVVW